jgi:hypothetical protein
MKIDKNKIRYNCILSAYRVVPSATRGKNYFLFNKSALPATTNARRIVTIDTGDF